LRTAKSAGSPFVKTVGSNQWASRWYKEPEVKWDNAVLLGRAQGTPVMPLLLRAPVHPPMMMGKPLWKVMIVLIPQPLTSLLATPFKLLANFLPRPNGISKIEPIT